MAPSWAQVLVMAAPMPFAPPFTKHNFVFELQIHALESDDLQRDESKR
jgi:hypothetical protein